MSKDTISHEPCISDKIRARLEDAMSILKVDESTKALTLEIYKDTRGEMLSSASPRFHALTIFLTALMKEKGVNDITYIYDYQMKYVKGWHNTVIAKAFSLSAERVTAAGRVAMFRLKRQQDRV